MSIVYGGLPVEQQAQAQGAYLTSVPGLAGSTVLNPSIAPQLDLGFQLQNPAPITEHQHSYSSRSRGSGHTSSDFNSHNNTIFSPLPSGGQSQTYSYAGSMYVAQPLPQS
jgi:hypothetical protein